MVGKTYLRYTVGPQGGAIASNASLSLCSVLARPSYADLAKPKRNKSGDRERDMAVSLLFAASLEAVRVYSVRSGVLQHTLIPAGAKMPLEVTTLRVVPLEAVTVSSNPRTEESGWMLMVGYQNGHVAVFSCGPTVNYGLPVCRFYALGHKSDTAVLALAVDAQRTCVCSGGQDTDLTVWDLVTQEASFRLRGHRGGVVGVEFVPQEGAAAAVGGVGMGLVVTGAADGLIKVWDIGIRQCVQTLVASDAQVASLCLDSAGRRLYCGLRENQLKVFNTEALTKVEENRKNNDQVEDAVVVEHGSIPRKLHKPVTSITFSHDGAFMLATTSKTLEIFRILTREDVRKKVLRKRKRRAGKKGNEMGDEYDDHDHEEGQDEEKQGRKVKTGDVRDETTNEKHDSIGKRNGSGKKKIPHHSGTSSNDPTVSTLPASTATEEVALLRTFFLDEKVRSACFIPPSSTISSGGLRDSGRLHIAVTFNNNNVRTYTTALTTGELEGAATWTLDDLTQRHTIQEGHQSDIREVLLVGDDTALLSLSAEKLMLWNIAITGNQDSYSHYDDHNGTMGTGLHDYYDAKEANVQHPTAAGTLTCTSHIPLQDAVSMAALSPSLCCVGQRDGAILLVDVPAAAVVFAETGVHVGGVRHITRRTDGSGFVTIGADRRLIVWTLALVKDGNEKMEEGDENDDDEEGGRHGGNRRKHNNNHNKNVNDDDGEAHHKNKHKAGHSKRSVQVKPQLLQSMEIELTESPLFLAFSPDNRFMAVGLQNTNIQLFFADTMKPYLVLFGHKLPPTAAAFSSDGTLVASVGMDKSLRLWGTDFGDCHRAIHAHDDYVTQVVFLQDTHQLLTVSLDGSVKHWDGDTWTMIQVFRQHQRGVWALAATANGTCIVTAGVDKCIRCFLRTQDIVFPEEEEERMAQEAMDEEAAKRTAMQVLEQQNPEVGVAGQVTTATTAAAEKLMEALDLVSIELQRRENSEDLAPQHPLLANKSVWEYLWSIIESVRPSELRHALSSLTSTHVDALLNYLETMLRERAVLNFEIAAKILLTLVTVSPGTSAAAALSARAAIVGEVSEAHGACRLAVLRRMISEGLDRTVGRMDYNIAGLQFVRQAVEDKERARFFDLSKIQGHKKRYHSRALPTSSHEEKQQQQLRKAR